MDYILVTDAFVCGGSRSSKGCGNGRTAHVGAACSHGNVLNGCYRAIVRTHIVMGYTPQSELVSTVYAKDIRPPFQECFVLVETSLNGIQIGTVRRRVDKNGSYALYQRSNAGVAVK